MEGFLKASQRLWIGLNTKVDAISIQFLDELLFARYADELVDRCAPKVAVSTLGGVGLNSLPNELLLAIFSRFVMDSNAPWHLTLVCRRWRELALETAALWTEITLSDSAFQDMRFVNMWRIDSRIRIASMGSTTICRTPTAFEDALRRARSSPIRLAFRLNQQPISTLKSWCSILAQSEGVSVRTLGFSTTPFDAGLLTELCRSTDVRNLEGVITYASHGIPLVLLTVLQTGPQLTSFHIPLELFLRLDRDSVGLHSRLEELELTHFFGRNLTEFHIVIPHYQNLRSLKISTGLWPGCRTPHIKLSRLETLYLQCSPYHLDKLELPELRTLYIITNDRECLCRYQARESTACFPRLTDMTIVPTSEIGTPWIQDIQVPSLERISFDGESFAEHPPVVLPEVSRLKYFLVATIDEFPVSKETFMSMSSVENVVLFSFSGDLGLYERTIHALFTDTPCPKLRTLSIGTIPRYSLELDLYVKQVVRGSTTRLPLLEFIQIQWKDYGLHRYTVDA